MLEVVARASALTRGQAAFVRSTSPQVCLAGGYGSGKTTGLSIKTLQLKGVNGLTPGLIIAPTRPLLFAVTIRNLLNTVRQTAPGLEPRVVDPQGQCYLDFGDGAPVFMRSATRPDSIEGLDVGWLIGDEIRYWSRLSYEIAIARVRVACALPQKAFGSTPSMGWMYDEFKMGKPDRELIVSGTQENAKNLAPGFIENLRQSYSPRMQRAVIEGEFTILEGAVFEEFDPNPHTSPWCVDWQPTKDDLDRCPVYLLVDPGYRRSAWIFVIERGPMDWVIFDQLMPENVSDMIAVEQVNARKYPIDEIWCDPAGDNTQSATGTDTFAALRHVKPRVRGTRTLRTITRFRDITFGIDKLRVLLGGYEELPIRIRYTKTLAQKERGMQRGIVKDLGGLRYPELKDGRPVSDKPLKDNTTDHSCLTGCTKVFSEDAGWTTLQELNGADTRILTPDGMRPVSIIGKMREQAPVWELISETGETKVATGDHPFLAYTRCGCGRYSASFSWRTVLQMRALLQHGDRGSSGVSASHGLDACEWCDPPGGAYPSRQRRQVGQSTQQPGDYDAQGSLVDALESRTPQDIESRTRGGGSVAQEQARARVARETRARFVEGPQAPGVYLPSLWAGVSGGVSQAGKILPSELQGNSAEAQARHTGYQRITSIREVGRADVWCAGVPGTGSFVLEDGSISSNTDALRYFAVSRWMVIPELRNKDPEITRGGKVGYRVV